MPDIFLRQGEPNPNDVRLYSLTGAEILPGVGELIFAGYAPTFTVSNNQFVQTETGELIFTGHAPTVTVSDNRNFNPLTGGLVFNSFAPTFTVTDNKTFSPGTGFWGYNGYAPTITVTGGEVVTPGGGVAGRIKKRGATRRPWNTVERPWMADNIRQKKDDEEIILILDTILNEIT